MENIKEAFERLLKDNGDSIIKNPNADHQVKTRLAMAIAIISGSPFVAFVDGMSCAAISPAEMPGVLKAMDEMKTQLKGEFKKAADEVDKL